MTYDPDREGSSEDLPGSALSAKRVLRIVLPSFLASTALAVAGVVLFVVGQRTIGLVLVIVGAVGGLAVRARLVYRAQMGGRRRER